MNKPNGSRIAALVLLLSCLFNTLTTGFCDQKSDSSIIEAIKPYIASWIDMSDIENFELETTWEEWGNNTCLVHFNIADGYKIISIDDLTCSRGLIYMHPQSAKRPYGQLSNEEIIEVLFHMLPCFSEIQEKLPGDTQLVYLLTVGENDHCAITSENIGQFLSVESFNSNSLTSTTHSTSTDEETASHSKAAAAVSTEYENALEEALSYLSFTSFSYSGLIDQLEYEGYSYDACKYAADHCGADWKEQAAKKAKSYLEIMAFSQAKLIKQLEHNGFTHEEAEYGARMNGY